LTLAISHGRQGDLVTTGAETDAIFDRLREPKTPRSRPRSRRLLTASALTVLGATLLATIYAFHHQPLKRMGWSSGQGGMKTLSDGVADYTGFLIAPAPGSRAQFSIDVENEGRLPVTITAVKQRFAARGQPMIVHWVAPDLGTYTSDKIAMSQLRAFPVTVRPGQQVTLMLSMLPAKGCQTGETSSADGVNVLSRALGVHHQTFLRFPAPIYLCAPVAGAHVGGSWTVHVAD
jgi:hypothetical protein